MQFYKNKAIFIDIKAFTLYIDNVLNLLFFAKFSNFQTINTF
jgi:hypothetical protein